mmetsp:Transcript_74643/g.215675  ORF Transcript_74643/g.215675 Transcript_74643/m.215675 type:complete len:280 (-) Transcript_74643:484-1323(-)
MVGLELLLEVLVVALVVLVVLLVLLVLFVLLVVLLALVVLLLVVLPRRLLFIILATLAALVLFVVLGRVLRRLRCSKLFRLPCLERRFRRGSEANRDERLLDGLDALAVDVPRPIGVHGLLAHGEHVPHQTACLRLFRRGQLVQLNLFEGRAHTLDCLDDHLSLCLCRLKCGSDRREADEAVIDNAVVAEQQVEQVLFQLVQVDEVRQLVHLLVPILHLPLVGFLGCFLLLGQALLQQLLVLLAQLLFWLLLFRVLFVVFLVAFLVVLLVLLLHDDGGV